MKLLRHVIPALLVLCTPAAAMADGEPPTPLFASDETIALTIRGPIGRIARNRADDAAPTPATLTVEGARPETLPVRLSARGITRRLTETCQFPPLRVEFPDAPGAGSLFQGQRRLKLVTHCRPPQTFQQYVILEYSAYQMYRLLTPRSFGARLARITYVDEDGKPVISRLGFFIEDVKDVARRNGLREAKMPDRVSIAALSPADTALATMFEYMIGNLDWAMNAGPKGEGCCHNARLIGTQGMATGLTPLPYDFDFSGLVDAPYATPPELIKVPNVRVRRYRGYCRHGAEAQIAVAKLLGARAAITDVVAGNMDLDARPKQKAIAYLDGFFGQIATEGPPTFLKTCV